MTDLPAKPQPPRNALSEPYWEAAARGELMVQACASCGKLRHYPRLICDRCHDDSVSWTALSARGVIHSWTVAHHAFHPAFIPELPYTIVTVDLEEGVRALGRWIGETPFIGQPAQGRFETDGPVPELIFEPRAET